MDFPGLNDIDLPTINRNALSLNGIPTMRKLLLTDPRGLVKIRGIGVNAIKRIEEQLKPYKMRLLPVCGASHMGLKWKSHLEFLAWNLHHVRAQIAYYKKLEDEIEDMYLNQMYAEMNPRDGDDDKS